MPHIPKSPEEHVIDVFKFNANNKSALYKLLVSADELFPDNSVVKYKAVINELVRDVENLRHTVDVLETKAKALQPRKIIVDGKVFIWRCPDEDIPLLEEKKKS